VKKIRTKIILISALLSFIFAIVFQFNSEASGNSFYPVAGTGITLNAAYSSGTHNGVDIVGVSTGVVAYRDGTVVYIFRACWHLNHSGNCPCSPFGGYGNVVLIEHAANGNIPKHYSLYSHLVPTSITVNVGNTVYAGQKLADMGSYGWSTGSHLHFEIRTGNFNSSNPSTYFNLVHTNPNVSNYILGKFVLPQPNTQNGWVQQNGQWYYYQNGVTLKRNHSINGKWYWFDQNTGAMHTGWRFVSGEGWYYYGTEGSHPHTSVLGSIFFRNQYINGQWYWFDEVYAHMYTGWRFVPGEGWYHYSTDGSSPTGSSLGQIALGHRIIGAHTYWFSQGNAIMQTGWRDASGNAYFYNPNGSDPRNSALGIMYTGGGHSIGGNWYRFHGSGTMYTGWYTESGNSAFYDNRSNILPQYNGNRGKLVFGSQLISNNIYYFNNYGILTHVIVGGQMVPHTIYTILSVTNRGLTDANTIPIRNMVWLRHLDLRGNPLSLSWVNNLRAALPNCTILF